MHAAGNLAETIGAVVHGIHGGNVGQQRLGRADIGRGFFTANVRLARLQGQTVGNLASRILSVRIYVMST